MRIIQWVNVGLMALTSFMVQCDRIASAPNKGKCGQTKVSEFLNGEWFNESARLYDPRFEDPKAVGEILTFLFDGPEDCYYSLTSFNRYREEGIFSVENQVVWIFLRNAKEEGKHSDQPDREITYKRIDDKTAVFEYVLPGKKERRSETFYKMDLDLRPPLDDTNPPDVNCVPCTPHLRNPLAYSPIPPSACRQAGRTNWPQTTCH